MKAVSVMIDRQKVRNQALAILRQIPDWELTPARWEIVAELLEVADVAVAAGDLDGLDATTVQLELVGPVRMTRLGATPSEPPPPPVRDRLNILVHRLSSAHPQEDE
ncbi:CATRA system-associated protein [Herbidospora mongoliensis]|uniref:CATRA system-associated protein n=1 Tax=Herbidospora mongoliensis TaxID=688067 RepID=UPI00083656B8|nr:CATRA system-associated protein [Herbidospora mongoliensis]